MLALFVRSDDMPESTDILLARPTILPPLDPEFRPVALGNRRYRQAVAAANSTVPLAIALERNDGCVSVFKTEILTAGAGHDTATRLYVERLVKFLLWQNGGWKNSDRRPERHRRVCRGDLRARRCARLRCEADGTGLRKTVHGRDG